MGLQELVPAERIGFNLVRKERQAGAARGFGQRMRFTEMPAACNASGFSPAKLSQSPAAVRLIRNQQITTATQHSQSGAVWNLSCIGSAGVEPVTSKRILQRNGVRPSASMFT